MKIGVLSDSHYKSDYQQEVITYLKKNDCEYLIHAGDLCTEENLKQLEDSNLKYVAVFGNNDNSLLSFLNKYNVKQEPYHFQIKDIKFKLMHLPFYLTANDSDIVIFGHTHEFECKYSNEKLYLNPGEVCAREKPIIQCVMLEINENEYIINYYFKNINEENFSTKQTIYKR